MWIHPIVFDNTFLVVSSDEEESVPVVPEKKGPYRYTKEEMLSLREAQNQLLPNLPKLDSTLDMSLLKLVVTLFSSPSILTFSNDFSFINF